MEYERVVNMLEYLKENIEKKYNNDKWFKGESKWLKDQKTKK
jgi:hypothetical protein